MLEKCGFEVYKGNIGIILFGIVAFLTLGGCMQSGGEISVTPVVGWLADTPAVLRYVVGQSVQGRAIDCVVLGKGREVVLFIAAIHGNERAGTPLVKKLETYLLGHPEQISGKQIVLVPVANPDGAQISSRLNVRGVDLNRNFPTGNRKNTKRYGYRALTEPESNVLYYVIQQYQPKRVVSIHQPLRCVDYDGPGKELAQRMAALCNLPVRKLGAKPGSLGSYVGNELGIPIITLELARADDRKSVDELWQLYGKALLAAITG
jgi:protein MpaA